MSTDDEIARFDWSRIQTYLGHAEMVPGVVRGLVAAPNEKKAARLGVWMERLLLSVAGPREGCAPVATVLVAALPEMRPAGHSVALDLLSLIGAAQVTGPSHEQIGAVDVDEIRRAVAAGFSATRARSGRSPRARVAVSAARLPPGQRHAACSR
ncbi:hypothetical protein [Micromonospora rhizosphaerae]|uniref:hypothetical protein n=1 Tax=Micromonospora rhizosphaerae TaxID=568872 RepID=UPI000B86487E|nr:hypothetical protein [Micromonospora rhizosphaerae]